MAQSQGVVIEPGRLFVFLRGGSVLGTPDALVVTVR